MNLRDVKDERGLSGYDRRFNDTTTITYEFPRGHGWASYFYGGWRSSVINSMYSGQPVNLIYSPSAAFQLSPLLNGIRATLAGDRAHVPAALVPPQCHDRVHGPDHRRL